MAEQRFDFLRELVKNIPDISLAEEAANYNEDDVQSSPEQESLSDASELSQRPTSSAQCVTRSASAAISAEVATDLSINGKEIKQNGGSTSGCGEQKSRRTRNLQQSEPLTSQLQQRSRELDIIERLQQRVGMSVRATPSASVIMHTDSLVATKLRRTESLPDAQDIASCSVAKRAKKSTVSALASPEIPPPTTAIPPPIVSFDLCRKPVVKIDYSNIPMTAMSGDTDADVTPTVAKLRSRSAVPLSAPAHIASASSTNTVFDFSPQAAPPISINIDLSNININEATATKPTTPKNGAVVANLSLSTLPSSSTAEASLIKNCANPVKPTKDSCFELDEDYDNI